MQDTLDKTEGSLISASYQKHATRLLAYLKRHTSSQEDAEDLLYDVFYMAIKHEQQFAAMDEEKRRSWLWTVAHNKLINYYRRTQNRDFVPLDDLESIRDSERYEPEYSFLQNEEEAILQEYLKQLPKAQQEVLYLRFTSGLRCTEIARILKKREGAIRAMLSRSLRALRSMFESRKGDI
ncbi:RNA polymerase sigma-70 factor (ECF subfamily) [Thermosporothrix hazakensis]|jgi:RNA polymerase sigma-70 factor (ECF subfamily)|uniref:RNA polymerase sigma-70 factor (ECF subfamily) n=2 Tax=Thermosporothrix TaxID=768650 RepID=A0A326U6K1_THEHA|nr:sigma-70 family RNA polymerase sigma factor [Thermosporothrix hazakensis]PZW28430.1 RNA polymerase sigma-70 factor (ECF subfamily) [Thermosporothrix hazakensis]BBH86380.1 hypothetical protein KTC_11310 [Thermosporothrix sp. COM3]GCE45209.1 hypothetical protein KTH_00780 [Thermosporothrix hazakensis]